MTHNIHAQWMNDKGLCYCNKKWNLRVVHNARWVMPCAAHAISAESINSKFIFADADSAQPR